MQAWSPTTVIETALADVQSRKAAWTRADLTAAINAALPDRLASSTRRRQFLGGSRISVDIAKTTAADC